MTEESIPEGEEKEDNDDDLDGPNDGDVPFPAGCRTIVVSSVIGPPS